MLLSSKYRLLYHCDIRVIEFWLDARTYKLGYFQDNGNCHESLRTQSASSKVETPIHDNTRELVTWECKEHGVKS
jgi:hypothetical protein